MHFFVIVYSAISIVLSIAIVATFELLIRPDAGVETRAESGFHQVEGLSIKGPRLRPFQDDHGRR